MGLGTTPTFGCAFHFLDAILAGEVKRIFGKITLMAFIVAQHQPKQAGRTTSEYVIDCPHGSDPTVTGNCPEHLTEGEDYGIDHTGLFHLFFHVLQNVLDGHAVKQLHKALVDHRLKGRLSAVTAAMPAPSALYFLAMRANSALLNSVSNSTLVFGGTFWSI